MLSFITFKDAPEQLEIIADEQGINDLISYLEDIKKQKDHLHLTIDTELNQYPIGEARKGKTLYAKQVRLQYAESITWI